MDVWMEILCTALTVTYATNPYTVLLLPKGDCHLCCPYHRDDIKLYMDIPGGPEEVYFDWENGSDWRLLDNNRTIAVYIHGFTEQHNGPAATEIRRAYRERGEDNLLVVDWAPLAAAPWYHGAVANTPHVGQFLAGVIDSLVIRGLPLHRFHVIGFSLGAEIAGLTAKRITVGKLSRVTGLDPALPLYDPLKPSGRLARSDADFVDVIHTDGGFFGFASQLGHADFFPNGGRPAQPGCRAEILVHTGRLKDFVACSHNRAWKYFAESVKDPYAFPATQCQSFLAYQKGKCKVGKEPTDLPAFMGYRADPRTAQPSDTPSLYNTLPEQHTAENGEVLACEVSSSWRRRTRALTGWACTSTATRPSPSPALTSPATRTTSLSPATRTTSLSPATRTTSLSPATRTTSLSPATRTTSLSPATRTTSLSPASRTISTRSHSSNPLPLGPTRGAEGPVLPQSRLLTPNSAQSTPLQATSTSSTAHITQEAAAPSTRTSRTSRPRCTCPTSISQCTPASCTPSGGGLSAPGTFVRCGPRLPARGSGQWPGGTAAPQATNTSSWNTNPAPTPDY